MQSEQFQLHAQIEERHWWFVARRRILREIVRTISPPPPHPGPLPGSEGEKRVIIDVGCGTGANLAAFSGEYRCVGVDTSAEGIALAKRRFPETTFICGRAPHDVMRWMDSASVVLLTDVLEHVADDRRLLRDIVDACPPEAQLLITVPADMRLWSPHDQAFGHYRRYEIGELADLWSDLPVKVRLLSYFNSRLYPVVRAVRRVSRIRGHAAGAANTDFKLPARPANSFLGTIFSGERFRLIRAVDEGTPAYRRGVSLIAVLQRRSPKNLGASASDPMPVAAVIAP
jgi:SAM-dependent methyltransferase